MANKSLGLASKILSVLALELDKTPGWYVEYLSENFKELIEGSTIGQVLDNLAEPPSYLSEESCSNKYLDSVIEKGECNISNIFKGRLGFLEGVPGYFEKTAKINDKLYLQMRFSKLHFDLPLKWLDAFVNQTMSRKFSNAHMMAETLSQNKYVFKEGDRVLTVWKNWKQDFSYVILEAGDCGFLNPKTIWTLDDCPEDLMVKAGTWIALNHHASHSNPYDD